MKIEIRKADFSDLTALARLNTQVQSFHAERYPRDFKAKVDESELRQYISSVMEQYDNKIIIAECEAQAVGYVWIEIKDCPETALTLAKKIAFLQLICVDFEQRRNGIGRALLKQMEHLCKEEGADEIVLGTWASNEVAQGFFRSCGFEAFTILMRKQADA